MSYSPVFSAPFIQAIPATPNTSFEVPPGFTAVVRQFTLATTAGACLASLYFQDDEVAPPITIAYLETAGIGQSDAWEGRVVVPAGGFIAVYINDLSTGANVYAGGYLLQNVVP